MEYNTKKTKENSILREGLVQKFIDSFFDAYKKGIQAQFINKTKQRDPELAKSLEIVVSNLNKAQETLKNKKPISK